ncbi:VOC family protein [Streptomyces sp. NPDC090493]|uniref:VOC family protein n=1 Tax=Streptomyces sp. NPDC090493 TaxID=3365964 RepID=UPI0037F70492
MDEFPFGQPVDAVIQMAYFVPDLKTGMEWWTTQLGVGPWFVIDRIGGTDVRYRGKPSNAEFTIALAYSGHMMIELIQALDDRPSIYKEAHEKRGYGFHHVAKVVPDLQEAVAAGRALGFTILHQSPTPGGGEVCFLDGGQDAPGAIELIADVPATRDIFTAVWRASVDWDGSDPYRSFSEILTAAGS